MSSTTEAQIIRLDSRRRGGEPTATTRRRDRRAAAVPQALFPPTPVFDAAAATDLEHAIRGMLAFIRRRLSGDYPIDDYGFDQDLTEHVIMPLSRPLYQRWWRVRALGIANVPDSGGALLVANHAGTLPFDAVMTKLSVYDEHPSRRHVRELAADLALKAPIIGSLARKTGNTLANADDAVGLLTAGELVGVWPEGFKGISKPYWDRYKLQRFGRGGFVEVAMRAGVSIIPVATIGSEEIYPIVANVRPLARLLGFPYFPVTWQFPLLGPLGLVPLPSKWVIEFGEPIRTDQYGPEAADDPMLVFEITNRVRDTIQQMIYRNLMGRRSIFF
jgi:1-acyl-sn-glycerol-3-phosphate acyltransferase